MIQPKFVKFEGAQVRGLGKALNEDRISEIKTLWQDFNKFCENKGIPHRKAYGICMKNHPGILKGTDETFVYVAAVPEQNCQQEDDGMIQCELPAGNYAVFTFSGPIAKFPDLVMHVWEHWVPENQQMYREGPDFELYDERFDPKTASGEVDIYIPVK